MNLSECKHEVRIRNFHTRRLSVTPGSGCELGTKISRQSLAISER